MHRFTLCSCFVATMLAARCATAGPRVDVVVGAGAPQLERFAAAELSAQFQKLFDADVNIGSEVPAVASHLILIGSPATNPAMKPLADQWPKLSDQGHIAKSVRLAGKPALAVGGGSPVATLWAVYELGHHFGTRSFLFGDLYPTASPELKLDDLNIVLEPVLRTRGWLALSNSPIGPSTWSLDEHKLVLGQLAKLKFNRVALSIAPGRPIGDVDETALAPFLSGRIAVDGDTAGRTVFRGARFFESPDLAGKSSDAAAAWAREIAGAAERLGMSGEARITLGSDTLRGLAARRSEAATVSDREARSVVIPLEGASVLPQMGFEALHEIVSELQEGRWAGFIVAQANPGDADLPLYYLSRAACSNSITPEQALTDLVTPVCGPEVADRIATGFKLVGEASSLIESNDKTLGMPTKLDRFSGSEPPPEWWGKVRDAYLNAMNEMYRANTRARQGGRVYSLYFARRFEFAFEYMNMIEAIRKAGVAKARGDADAQLTELEKAIESLYGGCNALAAVARTNTDRAIIAVLNENGYRPLKRALEGAESQ
jgi:hypothetical protein